MKIYALLGLAVYLPGTFAAINCRNVPIPSGERALCFNGGKSWDGCIRFCRQHCNSGVKACIHKARPHERDYDCYCV
ncbi:hypothetical protein F66182_5432 [Fusarium sp. NRRL 66182]|nr:hypothetical protein F66182_5432 [Fusarium sp. NRRL 66182]